MITSTEEIQIIEAAVEVIVKQKQAIADAIQQLTPLADENLKLRDTIRALESEDANSDAALVRLRDLIPQGPAPETPVTPPVPDVPVEPVAPPAPEFPAVDSVTGEPAVEPVVNRDDI